MESIKIEIGALIVYVKLSSYARNHKIYHARVTGQSGTELAKFRIGVDTRLGEVYKPNQFDGRAAPPKFFNLLQIALADELGYITG